MSNNKKTFGIIILISSIVIIILCSLFYHRHHTYIIDAKINTYNLYDAKNEDSYMNFIRQYIVPNKLNNFFDNSYIPISLLGENATGHDVQDLMKFTGYELLFKSLFDKTRTNFDDCPVTDNFKNKFNTNLLDYYNLKRSDDAKVNCSLDMENKKFDLEVYGIIGRSLNLEPNYYDTHHFTYTLDADGNVDDVVFNQK